MKKLTFKLNPAETKTEEQYFNGRTIIYYGSTEKIKGLVGLNLHLGNANGQGKTIPLTNVTQTIRESIIPYGSCYFSWTKLEQEVDLKVEIIV